MADGKLALPKEIKRTNYFTSQFLVEDDFKDEQAYHVEMRRLHNRALHVWGVVDGLAVSKADAQKVTVKEGMAIDGGGREVVLAVEQQAQVPLDRPGDLYVVVRYKKDEKDEYKGMGLTDRKYTRVIEGAQLEITDSAPDDGSVIKLAKIKVDANGLVGDPDNGVRRLAGSVRRGNVLGENDIYIASNGNVGIGKVPDAQVKLDVAGDIRLPADKKIKLFDDNHCLRYGGGNRLADKEIDGPLLYGYRGGALGIHQGPEATKQKIALRWSENGNVGIGTETPDTRLHIAGDGDTELSLQSKDNDRRWTLQASGGAADAGAPAGYLQIIDRTAGRSRLTINKDGNVGIGTANPTERLDVRSSGADVAAHLRVANADATKFLTLYPGKTSDPSAALTWKTGTPLRFATADSVTNGTASSLVERMRITGNGNVGIGTTGDPAAKLHVGSGTLQVGTAGDFVTFIDSSITHKFQSESEPRYMISRDLVGSGNAGIGFAPSNTSIKAGGAAVGLPASRSLAFYTSDGNNLIERVRVSSSGNVGIRMTEPTALLAIKAAVIPTPAASTITVDAQSYGTVIRAYSTSSPNFAQFKVGDIVRSLDYQGTIVKKNSDTEIEVDQSFDHRHSPTTLAAIQDLFRAEGPNGRTRFFIAGNGNVGIGTDNPDHATLQIAQPAHDIGRADLLELHHVANNTFLLSEFGKSHAVIPSTVQLAAWNGEQNISIVTDNRPEVLAGNSKKGIFIKSGGNVGIGTTDPTKGKVEIVGSSNAYQMPSMVIFRPDGPRLPYTLAQGQTDISLYADGALAAHYLYAFSDERIKRVEGRSDAARDLSTLMGIEITDYRYKDVLGKGDAPHKKVVAQQVEKVFPQAVSKSTDIIPDIYQQASFIDGWAALATDLKKGERVRLISDKADGVYEVLEVTGDKFRTDFKPEGDKVFVFGREVDDFRNVDYDAIAMLNVSATQQLKKELDEELKALRAENAGLKARLDALESAVEKPLLFGETPAARADSAAADRRQ